MTQRPLSRQRQDEQTECQFAKSVHYVTKRWEGYSRASSACQFFQAPPTVVF